MRKLPVGLENKARQQAVSSHSFMKEVRKKRGYRDIEAGQKDRSVYLLGFFIALCYGQKKRRMLAQSAASRYFQVERNT